ncbi:hypothetical protein BGZ83_008350 [Gryganskiella cystojenkinii]|nr:hypothetical protein BGZ83_008350 [Gryganskiella cystojenkinii]
MEPSTAISTLTPSSTTSSSIRQAMDIVFDIPELADAILDFLSPLNITRLRLTSKSLHQRCHHRFIMVLDSRREFNDDEEQEIIFTLPRRTKTSLDQPQPLPDPRGADKMRLVLRNQRHRNGILTTTGHNLLQTRADRIQVLDLELEATVKSWGRRLLREAHSLSWDDSSKMRIQRATFRISLDTKLDESWETILLGPRESISGGVGLTSASEVNTTGFSATTLRTRTDTLPPSRTGTRSPLFQALESFSIEVLDSFSRAQCLAGIPKALHCAGQLGIITNTLRSLSLVSTNTSQQLVWSELKECLVSCKVLESLSIVKLRLISEREIPGFKSGGESSDGDDDDSDSWNDKTVLQTLQSSKTTAPKSKPWADINLREVTVMTVLMTNLVRAEFVATRRIEIIGSILQVATGSTLIQDSCSLDSNGFSSTGSSSSQR